MLLGTLRNPLLPDELKNLFRRHMHTNEMPDESLEEESRIQVCTSLWLLTLSKLQYHIFQPYGKNSAIMLNILVIFIWELPI
jgi:hypothetical protein